MSGQPRITLSPAAGERELGEPALAGEWAHELAELAGRLELPWCCYLARDGGRPVAAGLFKGRLDESGAAEIAYLTFIPERGRGIASAVVRELVAIAAREGASAVCAHTLRERSASTAALEANGFRLAGEVVDPDDGPVWRWERPLD